jgi:hypothetical protein
LHHCFSLTTLPSWDDRARRVGQTRLARRRAWVASPTPP